ncbi:metalloregulator ArsR/SmtB family transcription factor [uncultured Corynebacterium sp.]|uniref:metalloregulator ArsR/SmtB family transcription factor n=1 Tax=uncultured Corynebacterium sp. TaxID=159447 RepID=UPI0025CCB66B|nr:metalloregulator ArsR/SmtB family transcription factor [uncultured Corynebacterium sp.]
MASQHAPNCCPAPAVADEGRCRDAASIFAALSDVTRLQVALFIYRCSPNPVCACSFPEVFNISRSTISHHLTKLVNAGILGREQQGKWAYYSIASEFDTQFLDVVAKHVPQQTTRRKEAAVTKILFACRQNAGRSQMAAAIAQELATSDVTIMSAGTEPAEEVHPEVRDTLAEIGLEPFAQPEKLDPAKVKMVDWVITMGCGESCPIFPGTHYEDWEVADPSGEPTEVVREIRDDITKRVKELLSRIS